MDLNLFPETKFQMTYYGLSTVKTTVSLEEPKESHSLLILQTCQESTLKETPELLSQEGFGIAIDIKERRVRERKAKKKAPVVRFALNIRTRRQLGKARLAPIKGAVPKTNNAVYSSQSGLTVRSIVKVLKRGLKTYRPDLHSLALRRLNALNRFKHHGKNLNKRDAKKANK